MADVEEVGVLPQDGREGPPVYIIWYGKELGIAWFGYLGWSYYGHDGGVVLANPDSVGLCTQIVNFAESRR